MLLESKPLYELSSSVLFQLKKTQEKPESCGMHGVVHNRFSSLLLADFWASPLLSKGITAALV
jgi:hypothetical protein